MPVSIYGDGSISGVSTLSTPLGVVTATTFSGDLTGNVSSSGVSTISQLNVGTGGTVITTTASGLVGLGTDNPKIECQIESSGGLQAVNTGEIALRYNVYYDGADKYIQGSNKAASLVLNSDGQFRFYNTDTASSSANSSITGWTERLRIDSSGRVTMPYQPSFRVGRNSNYIPGAGSDIIFNVTGGTYHHNNGGHYSTSNGRFTAPVAGMYTFSAHVIWQSLADGQDMTDAFYFKINNSTAGYSFQRGEYVNGTTGNGGYYTDFGSYDVYLEANEWVNINNQRAGITIHGNQYYTTFSGALLG